MNMEQPTQLCQCCGREVPEQEIHELVRVEDESILLLLACRDCKAKIEYQDYKDQ